jgi:nucleoid DNA-binding protein
MDSLRTEKIRVNKQAEVFITKTATKTLTNPRVVDRVMNFHFRDLLKALSSYSSVEISGFGRFTMSQNKLLKKLKANIEKVVELRSQIEIGQYSKSEEQTKSKLAQLEKDIAYLESRKTIDETRYSKYMARMEKSSNASREIEGINTGNQ